MKIGRYEVLEAIGQGAMGTVYRARDPLIERTVAIKTVPLSELRQEGKDSESRFLREAQSAGRLSHPNIVTIYDVGEADDQAYIAMEFLTGATLRDVMNNGPMPLDLAVETAVQMAEALAFAHDHGVIHRDIKPSNVVITGQRGHIKITDFGIAHLADSEATHSGQLLGSPRYMSPEQAMGRDVTGRSDIFSLGALLYEMLTGRYAFDGDSLPTIVYRVVNETPQPVSSLRPGLPEALTTLLTGMLHKQPEARPEAQSVAQALRGLASPTALLPPPRTPNQVPRLLSVLAFATPFVIFLPIGLGLIVIDHFIEPREATSRIAQPPDLDSAAAIPQPIEPDSPAAAETPAASPPSKAPPTAQPRLKADPYLAGLDKKQVELRIKRTELLLEYTDQHPDVVQVDRQLEQLRDERRKYLRQLKKKPGG